MTENIDKAGAVLWQRVEGALILVAGLALARFGTGGLPWWSAALIFFAPDLSFFGYLLGSRVGAFGYNLVHLYAPGVVFLVVGLLLPLPWLASVGALWLAHCGLDRMAGYGLKSPEGFAVTHLGRIGRRL